jgi:hypothetical protein
MLFPIIDILRAFQLAIVVLGAFVIYYGGKGYSKTKNKSLLFLAVGFAFVTIGAVAAGILFELLKFDLVSVETVEAGTEALGFVLIVYSIVGKRD